MMPWNALLLATLPVGVEAPDSSSLFAVRVGEARTVSHGTIPHAVILVENGEIVVVGQDLEIERGIPIHDHPDWVVTPGFVNCHTRLGLDGQGHNGSTPQMRVSDELYTPNGVWASLVDHGVTTLGLVPAGNGIPGLACAVRPIGGSAEAVLVDDPAYLKVTLYSNQGSKKMLRDGFVSVDKYLEKEQSEFDKWEKKNGDKDEDERDPYEPPELDEKVAPFLQLRDGDLRALIEISKASDWLHLLDVIGHEEVEWTLRVPLRDDIDLHYVVDQIGERETRVVLTPRLTFMPHTRRERNLAAELDAAGAHVAFTPISDSVPSHDRWLADVGLLVAAGLDADAALRAMTLEPAAALGVEDHVGSIEGGKAANLVFFDGDPFEVGTEIQAVMLDGELVFEEDDQ